MKIYLLILSTFLLLHSPAWAQVFKLDFTATIGKSSPVKGTITSPDGTAGTLSTEQLTIELIPTSYKKGAIKVAARLWKNQKNSTNPTLQPYSATLIAHLDRSSKITQFSSSGVGEFSLEITPHL